MPARTEFASDPPDLVRLVRLRFSLFLPLLALLLLIAPVRGDAPSRGPLTFERDIRPIFKARCFQCHGEGEKLKGGVDLRLRRLMLTSTDAGRVLTPGDPGKSLLLQKVASGEMPKSDQKLSKAQVAILQRWIEEGAKTSRPEPSEIPGFFITDEERSFWSFQPIRRTPPPSILGGARARTPVDAFVLAELERRNLTFAADTDRPALIRRLTLDLTGLPSTPDEIRDFVEDSSEVAYENLVDRLLNSPRYGERWGRVWLDVAGYADSNGGVETDSERPWSWRYRDYVIQSFNRDKSFAEFITEQLAGDELITTPYDALSPADMDRLAATGFLRMAPDPTGDGPADPDLSRNQVISDTLQIVSTSLLGLTVQCAQCHDHRYDPIPQTDYYRLRAVFEPAFDWKHWKTPNERLVSLVSKELRAKSEAFEADARKIDEEARQLHDKLIERFVQKQLELIPQDLKESVLQARRTPKEKRTEEQAALLRKFPTFQDGIILGEIDRDGQKQVDEVSKRAAQIRSQKPAEPMVHALVEQPGNQAETLLFHRGDHLQPKARIQPGGLSVLAESGCSEIPSTNATLRTTGRRLALARSLTNGKHPLTARVWVNRVWHQLMGSGIVPTLADFGALGERPSHPELLDWLADEWVSLGWRTKSLHRLIVLSTVYRQGSSNRAAQEADPENRWLGRMRLRRLDAESLRDSMLFAAGMLCLDQFGPGIPVAYSLQGQVITGIQERDGIGIPTGVTAPGSAVWRRSVYVKSIRTMPLGVMETFDAPVISPNCEVRLVSTVAPQSLMMMNDQFVLDCADQLARRVQAEFPSNPRDQVRRAWSLAFGVEPDATEVERGITYIWLQASRFHQHAVASLNRKTPEKKPRRIPDSEFDALASWCQTLFCANRFLYTP